MIRVLTIEGQYVGFQEQCCLVSCCLSLNVNEDSSNRINSSVSNVFVLLRRGGICRDSYFTKVMDEKRKILP